MVFRTLVTITLYMISCAYAEGKGPEPYTQIISRSQDLTLNQNRKQALEILVSAIHSGHYNKKAKQEMTKALDEISTLFYNEKTQKLFEYAKSLFYEPGTESQEKFQAALKLEPNNILIHLWISRYSLKQGKCDDALQEAQKGLELNPDDLPLQIAQIQSLVCLQKDEELQKLATQQKRMEQTQPLYYHLLMAQDALNKDNVELAEVQIKKAEQADKNFPEIYFWKTQIFEKQNKDVKEPAKRYIRDCKAMGKKDYLKYEIEPRTCIELKSFESEYRAALEQEGKKDL